MDHVKNAEARRQLLKALRAGSPIAVTGSGVSTYCGYGRWGDVLGRLADFAEDCSPGRGAKQILRDNLGDLVYAASALSDLVGPQLSDFMRKEFGPKAGAPPELVVKLCLMGFAHFFTLNYDPSLEEIHKWLGRQYEITTTADLADLISFMRKQSDRSIKRIVYLHGRYSDPPKTLAFAEDGYDKRYRSADGIFRRFLWATYVTSTLVFIGVGFEELQLNFAWWEMMGSLRNQGAPHFAIVGLPPGEDDEQLRNKYKKRYGVDPIFYEIKITGGKPDHTEFPPLLLGMSNELGTADPTLLAPAPAALVSGTSLSANVKAAGKWTRSFVKKHGSGATK